MILLIDFYAHFFALIPSFNHTILSEISFFFYILNCFGVVPKRLVNSFMNHDTF